MVEGERRRGNAADPGGGGFADPVVLEGSDRIKPGELGPVILHCKCCELLPVGQRGFRAQAHSLAAEPGAAFLLHG